MRSVTSPGLGWVVALAALLFSAAGCRRGSTAEETTDEAETGGAEASAEPSPPPADWPRVLVTTPGTGPAIYLGPERDAPAVGYLNPGVRVRLESAPVAGRVQVLVGGALATKGWVPLSRVGGYVQQRGRVEGTRAYVGPNDYVSILGPDGQGAMRVEVRPWLGGSRFADAMTGTFPIDQIADHPVEGEVEGVSPGECYRAPAGQTVTVYDRPRGERVADLPALNPPMPMTVLREGNGWYGVRVGFGPYITGYVQGPLTACEGDMPTPDPMVAPSENGRPAWMTQEQGALYRVSDGTRIRFHGETIARLRQEGWARELGRQEGGLVDVFVAADEGVALRGLVEMSALTQVEGAAAPAEPEEELPDELQ
ncbi:MAG: hypothetical protein AB7S26_32635 [Sandaracinaceae bacterium]